LRLVYSRCDLHLISWFIVLHTYLTNTNTYTKVHALMGTYDPPQGTTDDENQMGHITGALLQFPIDYTFSVVGKTTDGDSYASDVKNLVKSILGSDARMETRVVPRGSKFTRVSVKVCVESPAMIASIYEELDAMELTVMKF
jgi:putative lipoic acid-binding regulatory protein